jgi:hypothetical protein
MPVVGWALVLLFVATNPAMGAWRWLPEGPLAPPILADRREIRSSLLVRSGSPRLDASIGETLPLTRFVASTWGLQVDLGAALFVGFLPQGEASFAMLTVDGAIRVPVQWRWRSLILVGEWGHLSAHFADGVRSQGFLPKQRGPWSREVFRTLAGWNPGGWYLYAGTPWLVHAIPDVPGAGLQLGGSFMPVEGDGPVLGVDVQARSEHAWQPSLCVRTGWMAAARMGRSLSLGAVVRWGQDEAGQLSATRESYVGAGFDIHRTPSL